MKTLFDHLENAKAKPHHIRKRIAFGSAFAGTALIALVWLAGSLSTGAFAITGSSFAESTGQAAVIAADSGNENQNIAGALAGQAAASSPNASAEPHIEIVDVASSSTAKQSEQTIIPF